MPGQGQCTCCTIRAGPGPHSHGPGRDRETEPGGGHEAKPCRDGSCSGNSTAETEARQRHHHARTTAGCGKRSRWQGSAAQRSCVRVGAAGDHRTGCGHSPEARLCRSAAAHDSRAQRRISSAAYSPLARRRPSRHGAAVPAQAGVPPKQRRGSAPATQRHDPAAAGRRRGGAPPDGTRRPARTRHRHTNTTAPAIGGRPPTAAAGERGCPQLAESGGGRAGGGRP